LPTRPGHPQSLASSPPGTRKDHDLTLISGTASFSRKTLAAALGFVVSCATPLDAMHTARVLHPGHVELGVGWGQNYPVGAYLRITRPAEEEVKALVSEIRNKQTIALDPSRDIYSGVVEALSIAHLPSPQWEVAMRVGVLPRLELGLRYAGAVWRGEVYGQVYETATFNVAAGLGGAYRAFDEGVPGVLDELGLLSFSEIDVDATVLGGWNWKYGALYFGPKAVFSSYSATGALSRLTSLDVNVLGATVTSSLPLRLNLSQSWLAGGLIGARVGYRYVYLSAELAVYGSIYNPTLFGQTTGLGGLVLYPSAALVATF
jgi:hypothetical protein